MRAGPRNRPRLIDQTRQSPKRGNTDTSCCGGLAASLCSSGATPPIAFLHDGPSACGSDLRANSSDFGASAEQQARVRLRSRRPSPRALRSVFAAHLQLQRASRPLGRGGLPLRLWTPRRAGRRARHALRLEHQALDRCRPAPDDAQLTMLRQQSPAACSRNRGTVRVPSALSVG